MKRLLQVVRLIWRCTRNEQGKQMGYFPIWIGMVVSRLMRFEMEYASLVMIYFFFALILIAAQNTIFAAMERQEIETLYASLGISRTQVVRACYLLALILQFVLAAGVLGLGFMSSLFFSIPFEPLQLTGNLSGLVILTALNCIIGYPLFYRFGFTKVSRGFFAFVATLAGCDLVFFNKGYSLLSRLAEDVSSLFADYSPLTSALALGVVVLGMSFSYRLSVRIYATKDFLWRIVQEVERTWGKQVRTPRHFVSPDGSLYRLESTRKYRAGDLTGATKLPHSRRRLRTAPELAERIKKVEVRRERAKDAQADRRVLKIVVIAVGTIVALVLLNSMN